MATKHLLCLLCASLSSITAAELRITVYDAANLTPAEKRSVYDRLTRILRHVDIEPQIVEGNLDSPEATYVTVIGTTSPAEEQRARCRARRDIALNFRTAPLRTAANTLGISFPLASEGLNARIFADRVRAHAAVHGVGFATVLAYAAAHEIGHVLLRGAPHAESGLMGAVWTHTDYEYMATGFLHLDKLSSQVMRATLARERCVMDQLSLTSHDDR